jgi:hypothetical protein
MKLNLRNRQQLLTVVALVVVGVWAGDRLVLTPLSHSWTARKARLAELRKSVDEGGRTLRRERSLRDAWDRMRTNALPGEVSVAEDRVLKAFDRWREESRITITSIKPQPKRGADDLPTLEFRVDASGNLATITRFLYEVEKDPLALKVDLVELGTRDNDGALLTLGLQVSGLLYSPATP